MGVGAPGAGWVRNPSLGASLLPPGFLALLGHPNMSKAPYKCCRILCMCIWVGTNVLFLLQSHKALMTPSWLRIYWINAVKFFFQ